MADDRQVPEARLSETGNGLVPDGDGWFIVNVAEARGMHTDRFGQACRFEGSTPFEEFGINVRVIQPGQPNCLYHRENGQEAFLVLSGECTAVVEGQERPMRKGDFLYAPPGTAHVMVGAGGEPCTILMVGTRKTPDEVFYPVDEVAAGHGASAAQETSDPKLAYAGTPAPQPAKLPLW
jgi:uncharacterized cupin superfamily protein